MSTSVTIDFTASAGKLVLGGVRTLGPPGELTHTDFQHRDPVGWTAAQEFNNLGTTSGTITVTAS